MKFNYLVCKQHESNFKVYEMLETADLYNR